MDPNILDDEFDESNDQKLMVVRKHGNYSYFGEEDIIKKQSRKYNAVCLRDCELYTLDKLVGLAQPGT